MAIHGGPYAKQLQQPLMVRPLQLYPNRPSNRVLMHNSSWHLFVRSFLKKVAQGFRRERTAKSIPNQCLLHGEGLCGLQNPRLKKIYLAGRTCLHSATLKDRIKHLLETTREPHLPGLGLGQKFRFEGLLPKAYAFRNVATGPMCASNGY